MKNFICWIFFIFMGLCIRAYFPHFSSLIFAIGFVLSLPIPKVRDFWARKRITGVLKGILMTVIFFAGMMTAPHNEQKDSQQENPEPVQALLPESEPEPEIMPELESKPEPIAKLEPISELEPLPESKTEPAPEPVPALEPKPEPDYNYDYKGETEEESSGAIVYVSRSKIIHNVPDCSGMKQSNKMSLGEANNKGYKYCSNCW